MIVLLFLLQIVFQIHLFFLFLNQIVLLWFLLLKKMFFYPDSAPLILLGLLEYFSLLLLLLFLLLLLLLLLLHTYSYSYSCSCFCFYSSPSNKLRNQQSVAAAPQPGGRQISVRFPRISAGAAAGVSRFLYSPVGAARTILQIGGNGKLPRRTDLNLPGPDPEYCPDSSSCSPCSPAPPHPPDPLAPHDCSCSFCYLY